MSLNEYDMTWYASNRNQFELMQYLPPKPVRTYGGETALTLIGAQGVRVL